MAIQRIFNGQGDVYVQSMHPDGSLRDVEVLVKHPDGTVETVWVPKKVIGDFENGNLTAYETGDTSSEQSISVINDPAAAYDGDHYLSVDFTSQAGGGSVYAWGRPSHLANVPSPGQTFKVRTRYTHGDVVSEARYGLQEYSGLPPRGYGVQLKEGRFRLRFTDGGGSHDMASTPVNTDYLTGEWLTFEVTWPTAEHGDHTARLLRSDGSEFVRVSGSIWDTESGYHGGGFGFRGGRDSTGAINVRFDDAHIPE